MEDQLISFETAKLAKEKGFDEICLDIYELKEYIPNRQLKKGLKNSELISNISFTAPTQSLLQKWLREVHDIHVQPFYHPNTISTREIKPEVEIVRVFAKDGISKSILPPNLKGEEFDTYEKALEIGLQAALKLITIK
jgi:hypothetical protein